MLRKIKEKMKSRRRSAVFMMELLGEGKLQNPTQLQVVPDFAILYLNTCLYLIILDPSLVTLFLPLVIVYRNEQHLRRARDILKKVHLRKLAILQRVFSNELIVHPRHSSFFQINMLQPSLLVHPLVFEVGIFRKYMRDFMTYE